MPAVQRGASANVSVSGNEREPEGKPTQVHVCVTGRSVTHESLLFASSLTKHCVLSGETHRRPNHHDRSRHSVIARGKRVKFDVIFVSSLAMQVKASDSVRRDVNAILQGEILDRIMEVTLKSGCVLHEP